MDDFNLTPDHKQQIINTWVMVYSNPNNQAILDNIKRKIRLNVALSDIRLYVHRALYSQVISCLAYNDNKCNLMIQFIEHVINDLKND